LQHWRPDDEPDWYIQAATALARGEVLVVPTDTYYGLAADFRSEPAIERVLDLKGRDPNQPLLLLLDTAERAGEVADSTGSRVAALAENFWPGPLTLVLRARPGLHPALVGPSAGVAVRVPAAAAPRQLVAALGAAITGTSANRTGEAPARSPSEVDFDEDRVGGIVDTGPAPGGRPSTLVDLTGGRARVLRKGPVTAEALREVLGDRLV